MVDEYKLYFGDSIKITNQIFIRQPTMEEIKDIGEKEYYSFIYKLTSSHMDDNIIVFLTDMGVDFTQISDWELFMNLCIDSNKKVSSMLFGDLDFSSFRAYTDENGGLFIRNNDNITITEPIYKLIVEYIRKINNIPPPKFKKVLDNKRQKQMAIRHARNKIENAIKKEQFKPSGSFLLPVFSKVSLDCGFEEACKMNIFRFWCNVKRIQADKDSDHLYYGVYSGCLDINKNPSLKKRLDYMRALD